MSPRLATRCLDNLTIYQTPPTPRYLTQQDDLLKNAVIQYLTPTNHDGTANPAV